MSEPFALRYLRNIAVNASVITEAYLLLPHTDGLPVELWEAVSDAAMLLAEYEATTLAGQPEGWDASPVDFETACTRIAVNLSNGLSASAAVGLALRGVV